jgi:hypothetical protein
MDIHKPTDMLRTALSTVVLVATAVGSIFNLIQGTHLPAILLGAIVLVIVVLIVAEIRDKREKVRREAQEQAKGTAAMRAALGVSPAHLPPPPLIPSLENSSGPGRWDSTGHLILRMTCRTNRGDQQDKAHA